MLDLINVAIGFAGIMLLLAVIVTALVQAAHKLTRKRAKKLAEGLLVLFESIPESERPAGKGGKKTAAALKERVFEAPEMLWSAAHEGKVRAETTWIKKGELLRILTSIGATPEFRRAIAERFERMEAFTKERFLLSSRLWSFLFAAFVAVLFQVSSLELLRKLSQDPAFREAAAKVAVEQVARPPAIVQSALAWRQAGAKALAELAAKRPNEAAVIEQASGIGSSKEELLDELRLLFKDEGLPSDDAVAAYDGLLAQHGPKTAVDTTKEIEESLDALARVDIRPWGRGVEFYWNEEDSRPEYANVLGVLLTAVLLMLGAPFWFNALKSFVSLRDLMSGEDGDEKKETDRTPPPPAGPAPPGGAAPAGAAVLPNREEPAGAPRDASPDVTEDRDGASP